MTFFYPLLCKSHSIIVGKGIPPRLNNRCEVRCGCIYGVFPHGRATMIMSHVECYLSQELL